jgi:class 3 adenylate cyclase
VNPSIEAVLGNLVSLVAIGMGIAFLIADWRSVTSRVLAAFLMGMGATVWTNAGYQLFRDVENLPFLVWISGVATAFTMIVGAEWLLRIRRTIPAGNLQTRFGDRLIRFSQAVAAVYAIVTLVFWRDRAEWVFERLGTMEGLTDPRFFKFAVPFFLSIAATGGVALLTLRRKPDAAERMRLIALVVAVPFLVSGFVVGPKAAAYLSIIGLMIFLVGALEYHVAQGQRGQFMARFLAPQVADLVRREGLEQAIRDQKCEISVVYCDIRGFTAFAEQAETETVIGLLREYYDAIGAAATEVGGTIKDYAGDGVLILIGAPLPYGDRAARALRLAETLVRDTPALLGRNGGDDLAVGIGIASGPVSVGVVGGARLEYVAVGSTVNLAARLCQIARSGQILLDRETRELLGDDGRLTEEPRVTLKGFSEPVRVYAYA